MAREYRVISALGATAVPVPVTFGLCEDESVNGQPFYVMEFVEGHIVRDAETAERDLDVAARRRAG
jgi:aminoglycoside phosphotransferase (APT) family kinase protein